MSGDGRLEGRPEVLEALAADGVRTVADVLARAECVRDLPDRSNLVLRAGGRVFHVKRRRGRAASREAAVITALTGYGVPVVALAFSGRDRAHGSVAGTLDLAPARPLDDLLREGALGREGVDAAFRALAVATAHLHDRKLHHRDLYLCHVFVDPAAPSAVTWIDVARVARHHGVLGPRVVKDLAAIESSVPDGVLSCPARARFLRAYLVARRFPVRSLLGPLLRRVVRKAARIRAHVPRTPVGDAARPAAAPR